MNRILEKIQVSGIVGIRDALLELENPLRLESGEPAFDTPECIREAAIAALRDNQTHYVNSQGIVPLREALTAKLATDNAIHAGPDDILVTNGGMHALYATFTALVSAGDEVIIPSPNWTCVQWLITMAGATPVHTPLLEEEGFSFDWAALEGNITPRTKAILINSPHNPTGGVLDKSAIQRILALAEKYNLFVISDEAYEHIIYDNRRHYSPFALAASDAALRERIISVFTFSKSYAMTGWRLGYAVTTNRALMAAMKKVVLYSANGVNSISQWAGIAALKHGADSIEEMRAVYRRNRDALAVGISGSRYLRLTELPGGAFYCFARIADDWPGVNGDTGDTAFAHYLIDKAQLGCTPGSIFGPGGNGYIRFSYACSEDMIARAVSLLQDIA